MNAPKFWMVVPALLVAGVVGMANAKLPPLSDEAKAAAAEKKAKAVVQAKKDAENLGKAQDRAVASYKKEKGVKTAVAAPAPKKK